MNRWRKALRLIYQKNVTVKSRSDSTMLHIPLPGHERRGGGKGTFSPLRTPEYRWQGSLRLADKLAACHAPRARNFRQYRPPLAAAAPGTHHLMPSAL